MVEKYESNLRLQLLSSFSYIVHICRAHFSYLHIHQQLGAYMHRRNAKTLGKFWWDDGPVSMNYV